MKRFLIIAACLLMIVSTAIADEFSFREGICFGDSLETVQEKEGQKGEILESDSGYKNLIYKTVLSGIDSSNLIYQFNPEDRLVYIDLQYRRDLFSNKKLENQEPDYEVIQKGLISKYGQPIEYSDITELYLFKAGAISSAYRNKDYTIIQAEEWCIPVDDTYSIYIEHSLTSYKSSSTPATKYYHRLTYFFGTKDDLVIEDPVSKDL